MDQLIIALTGAVAIWLTQDERENWQKYACLFGLASQPFWFYATFMAGQWGMFALCFVYAYAWGKGFWRFWVK